MLGTGLEFRRGRGQDRFYNPAKARRANQYPQSDASASQSKDKPVVANVNRKSAAFELVVSRLSNLELFLESIVPSVPALYLSKTRMRAWRTCDMELKPYFVLCDLWESFKE